MTETLDNFLIRIDALFQHPASGHVAWVAIGRKDAWDHGGRMRDAGKDLVLELIGFGGDDDTDYSYLKLSVSLFNLAGDLLTRIEYDRPGAFLDDERSIVQRCLWWCVPRRIPLALLAEHGVLSRYVFDAPPTELIEVWDARYPLCVPAALLGIRANIGKLVEVGWHAEPTPDGVRLVRYEAPGMLARASEVVGRLGQLFGQQPDPAAGAGETATVQAGQAGLHVSITRGSESIMDRWFPIETIGALGAIGDDQGRSCPLIVFTNDGFELAWFGRGANVDARPVMRALELTLVSAMLGLP
jgi:hypothetical protein